LAKEKPGGVKKLSKQEMGELEEAWDVLEVADGNGGPGGPTAAKEKDLDDYVLWRRLKHEIEALRKELREGK
jgi:hypothetical protein